MALKPSRETKSDQIDYEKFVCCMTQHKFCNYHSLTRNHYSSKSRATLISKDLSLGFELLQTSSFLYCTKKILASEDQNYSHESTSQNDQNGKRLKGFELQTMRFVRWHFWVLAKRSPDLQTTTYIFFLHGCFFCLWIEFYSFNVLCKHVILNLTH